MKSYDHKKIESKWQKKWQEDKLYETADQKKGAKNFYLLTEFTYPSGNLHVGHWFAIAAPDILARYKRMRGFNVLYPTGFDAFGLPAENAAIKNKVNPRKWTYDNIEKMREQLRSMGASFDWSREVITSDPEYYKWTQWLFLRLFKAGLAEQKDSYVNWCPSCKTVLANEQVVAGHCERCGSMVEKRLMKQWNLKITDYAERLLADLDELDWPEEIKEAQRNWIGKSEGAVISFKVPHSKYSVEVFTSRPDTLFGATYLVLAPEHPLVSFLTDKPHENEVQRYIADAVMRPEIERTAMLKEKSGVFTGSYAINPATGKEIPIWVADYVLAGYGTGAIMAVPAHDDRDFFFALKYKLPVVEVVKPSSESGMVLSVSIHEEDRGAVAEGVRRLSIRSEPIAPTVRSYYIDKDKYRDIVEILEKEGAANRHLIKEGQSFTIHTVDKTSEVVPVNIYAGEGVLVNSGKFDGLGSHEGGRAIVDDVGGHWETHYRLRDWTVSRQRYWGVPIPIVHCKKCGPRAVPDDDLPVILPEIKDYLPRDDGKSPLSKATDWVRVKCPNCAGAAERETDTLDTFVDSSWYFLRYLDPKNDKEFASRKKQDFWMPVDFYSGGAEHITMHLLYSRFFHKALFDLGLVADKEPYVRRMNRGLILGTDGNKMSKRWSNVVDPDEQVERFGADTVRIYLAFIGPYNEVGHYPWSPDGIVGVRRFLERVWSVSQKISGEDVADLKFLFNKSIKKITEDIEKLKFNTAVSQLMILVKEMDRIGVDKRQFESFLKLLAPLAPHLSEELWQDSGNQKSIHLETWPVYDESKIKEELKTIAVQVNGRTRAIIHSADANEESIKVIALAQTSVKKALGGKTPNRTIYVAGKVINFIV